MKNTLKRAARIYKERLQTRSHRDKIKEMYGDLLFGSLHWNGLVNDLKQMGGLLLDAGVTIFLLLTTWAIVPLARIAAAVKDAWETEKHLENCDGCKQCSHLRDDDADDA